MRIFVKDFLDGLLVAFPSKNQEELIDEIQAWSEASGREGTLSKETFQKYKKKAAQTVAHFQISLIIREFLHGNKSRIKNEAAADRVEQLCRSVLERTKTKQKRFERNPGQDLSADSSSIDLNAGAYAIFRYESDFANLCQELIILSPGEGQEKTRYAVLIGRTVVMRGHWHQFGPSLYITGLGYEKRHKPYFMTIAFSGGHDISGGVLTGLKHAPT